MGMELPIRERLHIEAEHLLPEDLAKHSDAVRVNAARDRGVTEFLAKPVTARAILDRLSAVIYRPRPFITTSDYFGPDRRRRTSEAYEGPRRRSTEMANTLEL